MISPSASRDSVLGLGLDEKTVGHGEIAGSLDQRSRIAWTSGETVVLSHIKHRLFDAGCNRKLSGRLAILPGSAETIKRRSLIFLDGEVTFQDDRIRRERDGSDLKNPVQTSRITGQETIVAATSET